MKKLSIVVIISGFIAMTASAQVKPNLTANNHPSTTKVAARVVANGTRAQVLGPGSATPIIGSEIPQSWDNTPLARIIERPRHVTANSSSTSTKSVVSANSPTPPAPLTQTYRVGVGDILDIQLPDSLSNRSTLYTVTEGGLLDYPLAGDPLPIAGLTTETIATRLRAQIKVLDNPLVNVKVRDYASHTVKVIGFVSAPGTKKLRREAVPLYVVLSEALPLPEASSATIIRTGRSNITVDLRDPNGVGQLVIAGDVIKISESK